MICWYCYWGWSKPVAEIYKKALDKLNGNDSPLHFGPSHIVWEDENFDSAEWCLEHFDEYKHGFSNDALKIVKESLEELIKIPLSVRCPVPEEYDEENPELYPPSNEIIMERLF